MCRKVNDLFYSSSSLEMWTVGQEVWRAVPHFQDIWKVNIADKMYISRDTAISCYPYVHVSSGAYCFAFSW